MCGFVACMALSGGMLPERKIIETAVNTLLHRGQDDYGIWLSASDQVALAHRRLSIIALQSGHQPIANETHKVHMVANGEFYGYREIRQALSQRGHGFATHSDSEIALHLYEEKGASCLADLRGEFAFTLWDQWQQTLFAARDRFGIKPLYYTVHKNVLYLISEIKALLAR